ncbi:hypothetical protein GCM10028810_32640 [Spirosoma litoris]
MYLSTMNKMKFTVRFARLIVLTLLSSTYSYGQQQKLAKIYLGNPVYDIMTSLDPTTILKLGSHSRAGYGLIETDLDSIGLVLSRSRIVYLRVEPGKSYYYLAEHGAYKDISENAFWLSMSALDGNWYRHYILTRKSGVVLADDSIR